MLIPPLHIKLGLIRQFVTALDKDSAAFKYLQVLFPKLSEAKVKAGIFAGPQIKKIIECDEFIKLLSRKQKTAWNSFVAVVHGFLGNQKAENYVQLFQALIKNYAKMGWRISLEVQILDTHLEKFKKNMAASIKIYWTLKMLTKDSITKTWWGTTFGALFEKAICSTLATLENYSFLNLFEWFLTLFVYLPYKCCFLSHRMNKNVKLSSFFHNRYEIFLGWVHKIKVCAECSRFSIGFRHKQLKRNTWKPGTNIVLHCVTDDLNFSSDDSD